MAHAGHKHPERLLCGYAATIDSNPLGPWTVRPARSSPHRQHHFGVVPHPPPSASPLTSILGLMVFSAQAFIVATCSNSSSRMLTNTSYRLLQKRGSGKRVTGCWNLTLIIDTMGPT